jgi:hypothetical protein
MYNNNRGTKPSLNKSIEEERESMEGERKREEEREIGSISRGDTAPKIDLEPDQIARDPK